MTKTGNIKIIKEIKPKIRIIEKEEEEIEKTEETTEESLEDIALDAPSAREFPEFAMLGGQGVQEMAQREDIARTPSATTEEENKNAVRYQIQEDITEEEIKQKYQTNSSEARPILLSTTEQERNPRNRFANRELESQRTKNEENRYDLPFESEKPTKKRKFPWEV